MDKIFGTPTEPLFNEKSNGISPDILQEWLTSLAVLNSKHVDVSLKHEGLFKAGKSAEFVFLTCERLKLSADAKYCAVELFDRFMLKHVNDLYSHVLKTNSKKRKKDWNLILDRIKNQVTLRLVSCCQIASKLTSHYKVVTASKARRFLNEGGHRYTQESILQSELRILKTLDFQVTIPSTLVYIETILEILGYNEPDTEIKVYYEISLKVLEIVYLKFSNIYNSLFQIIVQHQTPSQDEVRSLCQVKSDKLLLAVSVIAAAVYVTGFKSDKMIECLHLITKIPLEDIVDFATIIIQMIIPNEPLPES
ncbi:cyclin N-terminal domain-containing protein 1-like isoform X1 [Mytilus edulis]